MLIGFFIGAAAMGALWWYVDSHGGVKAEVAAVEAKAAEVAKAEVAKVEAKL